MHGKIDDSTGEGVLEFLGKEPLATDLRQRETRDPIARGPNDLLLDDDGGVEEAEDPGHFGGLPQGQRTAASADADDGQRVTGRHH